MNKGLTGIAYALVRHRSQACLVIDSPVSAGCGAALGGCHQASLSLLLGLTLQETQKAPARNTLSRLLVKMTSSSMALSLGISRNQSGLTEMGRSMIESPRGNIHVCHTWAQTNVAVMCAWTAIGRCSVAAEFTHTQMQIVIWISMGIWQRAFLMVRWTG